MPDFVLGDFNVTENTIDRFPQKPDNAEAVAALRDFRLALNIHDQWRHEYPKAREYTYRAITNETPTKSRLDRIYVAKEKTRFTFEWEMSPSTVKTDHWLVSLRYAPKNTPYVGKGRWTMPIAATKNEKIMEAVRERGMTLQNEINELMRNPNTRTSERNPQTLWRKFKYITIKWAEFITKNTHHKRASKSKKLEEDRKKLLENPSTEADKDGQWNKALLANEIEFLKRKISKESREITKAKITLHGEKLGGLWSALSKTRKPRNLLQRLKIPDSVPHRYESRSDKMAELAKQYHENLQKCDLGTEEQQAREEAMEHVLRMIPEDQKFPNPQDSQLNSGITNMFVGLALKRAKNGSATGLDGCPYELWKELDKSYTEAQKIGKPGFNIVNTLTAVFNDIQEHGIEPETDFTEGWMSPLYKKKDKAAIENYRPITLLNTDYKLMTKALALQMIDSVKSMIHKDQAGFIPGRSIFNHIRLTKIMIQYAEIMEQNGAIIALDQEKAYDRITHEYLWKTMEAFNMPEYFRNTIKALYKSAETKVVINGVSSEPFSVTRGVRQGDPISYFLFDIAIEPLACVIRNAETIHGYTIPGTENKLIINLFADDTVLCVGDEDNIDEITKILDTWCKASGAKFNKEKTEIIPVGTKAHRERVIETRKINPNNTPLTKIYT
jgi:hypothetical protein